VDRDSAIDSRLRQYLLGELPERDRTRIEELYFADDDRFEQVLVAEEELIDAYVAGELDAPERERFEQTFLTTATRRERLAFARTLHAALAREATPSPAIEETSRWPRRPLLVQQRTSVSVAVPRWALVAAAAVLVLGVASLLVERGRLNDAIDRLQADAGTLAQRNQQLQQDVENERRRAESARTQPPGPAITAETGRTSSTPVIATFVLAPGLVRSSGGPNVVRIPPTAALVRLELDLESDSHPGYRPVLSTAEGQEVWRQQPVPARRTSSGRGVVLELPATLLTNRDYVLTLSGVTGNRSEEVETYMFRASRP
jgi:anti-sigma factor RsiW